MINEILCPRQRLFLFSNSTLSVIQNNITLISDTQNPEISEFQLRMHINTKPNGKQKRSEKFEPRHYS